MHLSVMSLLMKNKSWEDCEVNCIFDLDWNSNTVKFVDD